MKSNGGIFESTGKIKYHHYSNINYVEGKMK